MRPGTKAIRIRFSLQHIGSLFDTANHMKILWKYLKPQKWLIIAALTLATISHMRGERRDFSRVSLLSNAEILENIS